MVFEMKLFVCLLFGTKLCFAKPVLNTNAGYKEYKTEQSGVDTDLKKYKNSLLRNEESNRAYSENQRNRFANQSPTAANNEETSRRKQPHNGYPDVTQKEQINSQKQLNFNQRPVLKWLNKTITWKIRNHTEKLTRHEQRMAIINSMLRWESVCDIHLVETEGKADINIDFVTGDHGDGRPFDGPGYALAHAFGPYNGPYRGQIHFDNTENWGYRQMNGTDIDFTATHEIGHALGLHHVPSEDAVMFKHYPEHKKDFSLHHDDIVAIQNIYGPPSSPPTNVPVTVTEQSVKQTDHHVCNTYIDAATSGSNDTIHIFIGNQIYKFHLNCHGKSTSCLAYGFPKSIGSIFDEGPNRVEAAAFVPGYRQTTFLFKGRKVWRYHGYTLDEGFPKQLSPEVLPYKPSAAYVRRNTYGGYQMYIFGGSHFWEMDLDTEGITGTVMKTNDYWNDVPNTPHAITQTRDGSIYVFKRKWYNKFNHHRVVKQKQKLIWKDLLEMDCGFI